MHVRTFTYEKRGDYYYMEVPKGLWLMDNHVQMLLSDGWQILNSANDTGHTRVGKTLALGALTGGVSLLFGASRTTSTITLTFHHA